MGHHYYTVTRHHTSSSSYNTHEYTGLLVCIRALSFYINALLTDAHTHTHAHTRTHTHTHTHIGDRAANTSRCKETCQHCPTTFINNSLNTESLHYIFQQREDKMAVFEVNSLIVKRDAQKLILPNTFFTWACVHVLQSKKYIFYVLCIFISPDSSVHVIPNNNKSVVYSVYKYNDLLHFWKDCLFL